MSEKQIQEHVMQSQSYAVEIEIILRDIFKCDRFGFGGQVNSDDIRKHHFLSMTQALAFIYVDEKKGKKLTNSLTILVFIQILVLMNCSRLTLMKKQLEMK